MNPLPGTTSSSTPTVADLSERDLIARIRARLPAAPPWLLVGIGDDAAVVEPERNRVEVLTVDCIVEGVHFDRRFVPPDAIGRRAIAVNVSDLASMGAAPRLAVVSMALPPALAVADFDAIVEGLTSAAAEHRLLIVGGNLTRTGADGGALMIDVTAMGTVKRRQALTRGGAKAGDDLYVTGMIGAAAAGLQMLREGAAGGAASCVSRYLRPEARARAGVLLARNRAASACMDLSDGLADAVRQIAEASGVGARVDEELLPIEAEARDWFASRGSDPVLAAVTGGDDYELLFAVRPRLRRRLDAVRRHGRVAITRIGVCTPERDVVLAAAGTARPMPSGYAHFRPADAAVLDDDGSRTS